MSIKMIQRINAVVGKVRTTRFAALSVAAGELMLAMPAAQAQLAQVNTTMNNVQMVLAGVSVTSLTIATMLAGYKIMFQHAKISDVGHIIIGGLLVGGASGIAAWLA